MCLRILLATYWLVPHLGGVWSFMEQIQKRLESQGHQVDLLGNSPDYQKFHIVNTGQEIHKKSYPALRRIEIKPYRLTAFDG